MDYLHRTWADIDLDHIKHNYREMKNRLSEGCRVMAVVKADAYGHGDGYVSRALQQEGAEWFAVSNIHEAISLRRQEVARPILVLGFTPAAHVGTLARLGVSQTVYSMEYAKMLSQEARKQNVTVDCHIKVDTGMTRIGFYAQHGHEEDAVREIAQVCALPGLQCTGIFTHLSCADEYAPDSKKYTLGQFNLFMEIIDRLEKQKIRFFLRHCCNSAGALAYPQMHLDMVRLGVVLYGLTPSPEYAGLADLRPAMSLYTTVILCKTLEEGVFVSYGRRYCTLRDKQTIASIAIGYADGYRRNLGNKGKVIVRGEYAPVVGTVCMDQLMADVSGIPGVAPGDVVTLVGAQGDKCITLDDFAEINGTINYEECCLIGRRVPRVYIENKKEIAAVDYIIATL